MTFLEFNDLVDTLLPADAKRKGRSMQAYLAQMKRLAIINVQRSIEYYRIGHETKYGQLDVGVEGRASVGKIPAGANLQEAWILQEDVRDDVQVSQKYPVGFEDWVTRDTLIYGNNKRLPNLSTSVQVSPYHLKAPIIPVGIIPPYMAVSPQNDKFILAPKLDGHELPVMSMTLSGGVVTVVLGVDHGWEDEDRVETLGADQTEYNGEHAITVVDKNIFTYNISTTPVSPATGTINVRRMTPETSLLLVWDGVKLDFDDADNVPFDEDMAFPVSLYTAAFVALKMRDQASHTSHMGNFRKAKAELFVERKDITFPNRAQDRNKTPPSVATTRDV